MKPDGTALPRLLVVDDQPTQRRLLYHALKGDYEVVEAGDGDGALARAEGVDLVLLDLHLPPETDSASEGIRTLQRLRDAAPWAPVVIVTGDQDRNVALEMVRRGVADFLLKPLEPDVLKVVLARALERARLEAELRELRGGGARRASFGGLIGTSPPMRALFGTLERLARTPVTVLLLGETGTGKSAAARALHVESPRAGGPFVVVDGAAIPETLIESELFGHARGAFTGAGEARVGRLELADGGTLFLDEIGNLSPATQSKLLLFLDQRTFTPVGSNRPVGVDVRLVAATHHDLERLAREHRFRRDLLFRIQGASVELPPLRERREDIGLLAEYFLAALGTQWGRSGVLLSPAAIARLEEWSWPGNVRQLHHVLESALALADGELLDAHDIRLPDDEPSEETADGSAGIGVGPSNPVGSAGGQSVSLREHVTQLERRLLLEAIENAHGNKTAAGRALGLDENQIRYLCRKHRIR